MWCFLGEINSLLSYTSVRYQLEAAQGLQKVSKGEHLEEVKKNTINALISGGGNGNPFQYSCLVILHGQKSLVGYSHTGSQRAGHDWLNLAAAPWLSSWTDYAGVCYTDFNKPSTFLKIFFLHGAGLELVKKELSQHFEEINEAATVRSSLWSNMTPYSLKGQSVPACPSSPLSTQVVFLNCSSDD